ncbi:MAG: hypothetical protein J6C46_04245 [Clostridia bacterium]|nr:hypothetical protein [Clostridia bacterium]
MMFSSNQILEVSGSLSHMDELETALEFALKYSGNAKSLKQEEINRGNKLVYQITEDGKYCLGWSFKCIPNGWNEYPFRFEIDIVSRIIRQHLESFPVKEDGNYDGSYRKGFLMKCVAEDMSSESDGIKEPFYCIVYFEPYTCFYSK